MLTSHKMNLLSGDERNPLADRASQEDLFPPLAHKAAKALIGFDGTPPPEESRDKE